MRDALPEIPELIDALSLLCQVLQWQTILTKLPRMSLRPVPLMEG